MESLGRTHGEIFGHHMKIVVEQVRNYRSEHAHNSELSQGTTYLIQLFSQCPGITTAPQLVHSGVHRGKLETSLGAAVFSVQFTEISKNKAVFWFPFSLDPVFLWESSTSFGKESANSPTNEI